MPPPSFLPNSGHPGNTRNPNRHSESGIHMKFNQQNPHLSDRFSGSGHQSTSPYVTGGGAAVSEGTLKKYLYDSEYFLGFK